jgi:hypothetical protein
MDTDNFPESDSHRVPRKWGNLAAEAGISLFLTTGANPPDQQSDLLDYCKLILLKQTASFLFNYVPDFHIYEGHFEPVLQRRTN